MTTNTPRWTLITVTYNSATTLQKFWSSFAQSDLVEWIVVDNNSSDNSAQVAEQLGATVIRSEKNLGFGGANNLGYRRSTSPYVAFVNPDVTVDLESLEALEEVIDAEQALVSPQLLNSDGSLQPNGRGLPVLTHKVLNRLRPAAVEGVYRIFAQPGEVVEVPWVIGAALASNRAVFDRLGPWDEYFFIYYEDADICLRARKLGIKTLLIGNARWLHGWARATAKLNKSSFAAWKLEFGSMYKFYTRYPHLILKEPKISK